MYLSCFLLLFLAKPLWNQHTLYLAAWLPWQTNSIEWIGLSNSTYERNFPTLHEIKNRSISLGKFTRTKQTFHLFIEDHLRQTDSLEWIRLFNMTGKHAWFLPQLVLVLYVLNTIWRKTAFHLLTLILDQLYKRAVAWIQVEEAGTGSV